MRGILVISQLSKLNLWININYWCEIGQKVCLSLKVAIIIMNYFNQYIVDFDEHMDQLVYCVGQDMCVNLPNYYNQLLQSKFRS